MTARHAVGDEVTARHRNERWRDAIVREVCHVESWIEYRVSFRRKDGAWGRRIYWAEVQRDEAKP